MRLSLPLVGSRHAWSDYAGVANSQAKYVALLIACAVPLFFLGLDSRDLTSSHEARAAQNAQMMLATGDWSMSRLFDRHLDLQKPPLYYWLVALVAQTRHGLVDAWAVSLPAALSALGA